MRTIIAAAKATINRHTATVSGAPERVCAVGNSAVNSAVVPALTVVSPKMTFLAARSARGSNDDRKPTFQVSVEAGDALAGKRPDFADPALG